MSAPNTNRTQRLAAEALGSAALACAVVGSGVMAERLAGGNAALALLCNALATAAVLWVLITTLGPISGAHLNPVVSLIQLLRRHLTPTQGLAYIGVQCIAMVLGVWVVHLMFDVPLLQVSMHARSGAGLWLAEVVATFGLVVTILLAAHLRSERLPAMVASYVFAAYWFTASTSFANPAITLARALTNTFAGIAPADVAGFVLAQIVGALLAWAAVTLLTRAAIARPSQ